MSKQDSKTGWYLAKGQNSESSSLRLWRRLTLTSAIEVLLSQLLRKLTSWKVSCSLETRWWLQICTSLSRILAASALSWSLNLEWLRISRTLPESSLMILSAMSLAEDLTLCRLNSSTSSSSEVRARSTEMSSIMSLKVWKAISLTMLCSSTSLAPRSLTSWPSLRWSRNCLSQRARKLMQQRTALLTFQHFSSASSCSQYPSSSSQPSTSISSPASTIIPSTLKSSSSFRKPLQGLRGALISSRSSLLKVLMMKEREVRAASRMSQIISMLSRSSEPLNWATQLSRRWAVSLAQKRISMLWLLSIWERQSSPFLTCLRASGLFWWLCLLMKRRRPKELSLRAWLTRSLSITRASLPRQLSLFLIMSSLFLVWTFLRRQRSRFLRSYCSLPATLGHFLMNSVIMLMRIISSSTFLSWFWSRCFTDFRNRFPSFSPNCSAAWWITVAAHAPYRSRFFSDSSSRVMCVRIFQQISSTCQLGRAGTMSARYLMASDWTVSFSDSICFMKASRMSWAVWGFSSRFISPWMMSSAMRLAAISMLSGSQWPISATSSLIFYWPSFAIGASFNQYLI